jgi:hypothetical protein
LVIKTLNPNPDPEPDPKPEPDSLEMLNPDPDSMNPDLHCNAGTRVLTSGEQKFEKFTAKKNVHFLIKNCNLLIPGPPYRTSKLQEKSSSLSYTSKLALSSFLLVNLALLDPDPYTHYGSGSRGPK